MEFDLKNTYLDPVPGDRSSTLVVSIPGAGRAGPDIPNGVAISNYNFHF